MYQIFDSATPKHFALYLGLFFFFQPSDGLHHLHWQLFRLYLKWHWKAIKCKFNTLNQCQILCWLLLTWNNEGNNNAVVYKCKGRKIVSLPIIVLSVCTWTLPYTVLFSKFNLNCTSFCYFVPVFFSYFSSLSKVRA